MQFIVKISHGERQSVITLPKGLIEHRKWQKINYLIINDPDEGEVEMMEVRVERKNGS